MDKIDLDNLKEIIFTKDMDRTIIRPEVIKLINANGQTIISNEMAQKLLDAELELVKLKVSNHPNNKSKC